jgi:hypothetical protein
MKRSVASRCPQVRDDYFAVYLRQRSSVTSIRVTAVSRKLLPIPKCWRGESLCIMATSPRPGVSDRILRPLASCRTWACRI